MYGYIYLTKDLETGLIYIGQKKSNKFLDNRYLGSGVTLRNILDSGATKDRFEIKMIDTADTSEELNQKEIYWIDVYDATNPRIGYNRCYGGMTNTGFKQSDYQKDVASNYMRNRIVTSSTRANMSYAAKNRTENRVTNNNQVWMTNHIIETMATSDEAIELLTKGYYFGRLPLTQAHKDDLKQKYSNSTYMMKNNQCKLIANNDIDNYIKQGWVIQRNCYSDERNSNVSRGKSGTIKIIHPETLKIKYIKPDDFDTWASRGFIRNTDFKKNTL